MNQISNKKSTIKIIIMAVILLCLLQVNSYSLFIVNAGEKCFEEQTVLQFTESSNSMESDIVNGAGYFLKSYSDTLLALNLVETSTPGSLDTNGFRVLLKNAMGNMMNAVANYRHLEASANATPYKPVMIQRLQNFDYMGLCAAKGLNESIMRKVASFLSSGDVRGVFENTLAQSQTILKLQQSIYYLQGTSIFQNVELLWRLNNKLAESVLFGQYCAQVFNAINN
ncbi:MAG: hypothetical protein ACM3SY_21800 [Candidatus Omnitrophota bacterium]